MTARSRLATQLACPTGLLGRQAAREMAMVNRRMILFAIEMLEVAASHSVVEIGFGGGRSLGELATQVEPGRVIGVDHSPTMVAAARRRNRRLIRAGTVEVMEGSAEQLPLDDQSADRVLAVNSLTYWHDPQRGMREIARVMRPDARAVISVRPPEVLHRLGIDAPSVVTDEQFRTLIVDVGLHHDRTLTADDRIGGSLHFAVTRTRAH